MENSAIQIHPFLRAIIDQIELINGDMFVYFA